MLVVAFGIVDHVPQQIFGCLLVALRVQQSDEALTAIGRAAETIEALGQILIVMTGLGWVQREGGPVQEIRPGDVVWFEPGEKHWHGASPTTAMSHIAIQEKLNGSPVDWMEHVTDDQYRA